MKKLCLIALALLMLASALGEGSDMTWNENTRISQVVSDPAFEGFGDLIFPADANIPADMKLKDAGSLLMWYTGINPARTVSIVNEMKARVEAGETIFYDIYTDAEKAADPAKEDTGLFFFRADCRRDNDPADPRGLFDDKSIGGDAARPLIDQPRAKFAIVNAGGGFVYVGAMHDSFPHMQALAARGYNAFALIYRPGAQTACEDLARAIAFIHEHAEELGVDVTDYSLWGGSAGARMAAWLGTYGTAAFGEKEYPKPAAVIVNYTGLSEVTGDEVPTYSTVGTRDGIASYRTMQSRINAIKALGIDAEIEIFDGMPHGFGLGEGTVAEGWLDNAVTFWERNMKGE